MPDNSPDYKAIVIGASAGGFEALSRILNSLPPDFDFPVLIVQHIGLGAGRYLSSHFDKTCKIKVKEAEEKEKVQKAIAYFAPPDYHMLIEEDFSISFSTDKRVNYARPSIDVLFETASWAYQEKLIGIILTGANNDGAKGMDTIQQFGGMTIVQDPEEAEVDVMPKATLQMIKPDRILNLEEISRFLIQTSNAVIKRNKQKQ